MRGGQTCAIGSITNLGGVVIEQPAWDRDNLSVRRRTVRRGAVTVGLSNGTCMCDPEDCAVCGVYGMGSVKT